MNASRHTAISRSPSQSKPQRPKIHGNGPVSAAPAQQRGGAAGFAPGRRGAAMPTNMLGMQRLVGNRAVQRLIDDPRGTATTMREALAPGPHPLTGGPMAEQTEGDIQRARGGGKALPRRERHTLERSFGGADFGGVRLHTDARADQLNRAMSAQAFTVGSDVFLSQGAYRPGTALGNRLLAHELTHVVQQVGHKGNKVQAKLTVGPAHDAFEREAEQTAGAIASASRITPKPGGVNRAPLALARTTQTNVAPAGRVQRILSANAQMAANYANTVVADYMMEPMAHIDVGVWLHNQQWLSASNSNKIVAIKRPNQGDAKQIDRLKLAQAFLLKVFFAEFGTTMAKRKRTGKFQTATDKDRKAAIPPTLAKVEKEKEKLRAMGIHKPGAISAELLTSSASTYSTPSMLSASRGILTMGSDVDTTARVEWRGTRVPGGALRKLGWKLHSIILYSGADGNQKYISSHADSNGLLQADMGIYSGEDDMAGSLWEPTGDRMTLETGPGVEAKFPALEQAAQDMNSRNLRYHTLAMNCNRAAYHILKTAGVRTKNPPGMYVGWGYKLPRGNPTPNPQVGQNVGGGGGQQQVQDHGGVDFGNLDDVEPVLNFKGMPQKPFLDDDMPIPTSEMPPLPKLPDDEGLQMI